MHYKLVSKKRNNVPVGFFKNENIFAMTDYRKHGKIQDFR
jgi:hypothetical protein